MGYRFFDTFGRDVAYPFGFGLSYTTFDYAKPTAKVSGDNVVVSVTVKNSGKVSGKEVVQVYVAAPQGRISKPAKELKAFAKTRLLNPGESQTVTMTIARLLRRGRLAVAGRGRQLSGDDRCQHSRHPRPCRLLPPQSVYREDQRCLAPKAEA